MSSILTNNSAMVALSTLRNINQSLAETQGNISTGKKIANAKDNAAVWSVSAVMQSDVAGFKAITDSLALGASTLSVARNGAETVNNLLTEMKGRIVASQADNVDRSKIQADVLELRNNINATVEASQFNGLNMLKGDVTDRDVEILGSLDRDGSGSVAVANINVARMTLQEGTVGTAAVVNETSAVATDANVNGLAIGAASTYDLGDKIAMSVTSERTGNGIIMSYTVSQADLDANTGTGRTAAELGALVIQEFGKQIAAYDSAINGTAAATITDEATAETAITAAAGRLFGAGFDFDFDTANIRYSAAVGAAGGPLINIQGAQGGGLAELALVDVSTKGGAAAALSAIEGMTQSSINAAASFGSSGKRVDIQMDFLKGLTDSLTSGIGSLVDADMEETSARLQALQVQQQLGVQALSIANQQPQTLLSLFR